MSRVYRIRVAESAHRHIRVDDGFQVQLELLNILAPEQMSELLATELEGLGFERDKGRMHRNDEDGVQLEVDLENGTVTARLSAEEDLDLTVERTRGIEEERMEQGRARLEEDVKKELEREVDAAQGKLAEATTELLEKKLRDLRKELDTASNRAIAGALKIKASQMGQIQEISENAETGEITIKVQV
jgi:hypothetical protein